MIRLLSIIFQRTWVAYALIFLAFILLFKKEKAVDDYLNAAKPSNDYVYAFSYGLKQFNANEVQRSMVYYRTLLLGGLKTPVLYSNLGFCSFYLKDLPAALENYKKAIEIAPGIYTHYFDIAYISLFAKDYSNAVDLFERTRSLLPKGRKELFFQFNILPKFQDALPEDAFFVKRLDQDRHIIFNYLCNAYAHLNKYEQTLKIALEGLGNYPSDPELFFYAGLASKHLSHLREAVYFLSQAITLAPQYDQAYVERAEIMKVLGNDLLFDQDMKSAQSAQLKGGWVFPKESQSLHYYHDSIISFQFVQ